MDLRLYKIMKMYGHVRDFLSIHALSSDDPDFQNMWFFLKYLSHFYSEPPKNGSWTPLEILNDLFYLGLISFHNHDTSGAPWKNHRFNLYTFNHIDKRLIMKPLTININGGPTSFREISSDTIAYATIKRNSIDYFSISCIEQYVELEKLAFLIGQPELKTHKDLIRYFYQTKKILAFDSGQKNKAINFSKTLGWGCFNLLQIHEDSTTTVINDFLIGE